MRDRHCCSRTRSDQWKRGLLRYATCVIIISGFLLSTLVQTTSATPVAMADPKGPLDVVKAEGMNTSGGWKYDVVHKGGVGNFPSMAIDSRGNPHVVFIHGSPANVTYAWRNGTSWEYERLNTSGTWIEDVALAIGPDDSPHIVYTDFVDRFMYAHKRKGTWDTELIDQGLGGYIHGLRPCIAVDSQNRPYVGRYEGDDVVLKQMYFKLRYRGPDGWLNNSRSIFSGTGAKSDLLEYFGCSIAVDSNDLPHVSYFEKYAIVYCHWNVSWMCEAVPPHWGYYIRGKPSLSTDSNNSPHISYVLDHDNPPLGIVTIIYATKGPGGWLCQELETMTVWRFTSVAVDTSDIAHIAYIRPLEFDPWGYLTIARFDGGWKYDIVDYSRFVSTEHRISLAFDSHNHTGVLYDIEDRKSGVYELRYAYKRKFTFVAERRLIGGGERTLDGRDDVAIQPTYGHPLPTDSWHSSTFAKDKDIVIKAQAITVKSGRSHPTAWIGDDLASSRETQCFVEILN